MSADFVLLVVGAMAVYLLVLWTHSLRRRVGLAPFYALLGGITAVMSWVTDAGVQVNVWGITFMVGSTVFYTSLLLGVFVVYVFDGIRTTRITILTIAGVSALVPFIAFILHLQARLSGYAAPRFIPVPSLRVNTASVLTTIADLVFLALAWETLGKLRVKLHLWSRTFLTLLGVMWVDVLLFSTGAFLGADFYTKILRGTLVSRFAISLFAFPFLYLYLRWRDSREGSRIENRPVLSILREFEETLVELDLAQREIEMRKRAEAEKIMVIAKLEQTLAHVQTLEGLLSMCSSCKRIRIDSPQPGTPDQWVTLENYVRERTSTKFSHGICDDCIRKIYPKDAENLLNELNGSEEESPTSPRVPET